MNIKFKLSQLFGLSSRPLPQPRAYHHHPPYHWDILVDKLKKEFPLVARRLESLERFRNGVKMMASFLGRECSPIVAQRVFRSYRMFQLHSKLWSYSSKHPVTKRALFSFVILSLCKANDTLKLAIEDSELSEHIQDIEFIRELTAATVVCPNCKDRLAIDKKVNGVEYCHCPDASDPTIHRLSLDNCPWVPFAETPDLLIWRQPHPDCNGCYIYKVYGYYDDISAEDFLEAQLDIEYRKHWDDTALKLEVIESFPETQSDIIYWEMKWPRMFSNRDYLFVRRHKVEDGEGGQNMVIMSKACTHSRVPEKKGVHRVREYWSVMHIKAAKGISQTGVEFGLTYFDNPGVSLPQWLCNWAAMTGIPEFLDKQRNAARIKRMAREARPKQSISVSSSKSHFSDKRQQRPPPKPSTGPGSPPPPPSQQQQQHQQKTSSPPSTPQPNLDNKATYVNNVVPKSDNCNGNGSNNCANTPPTNTTSPSSSQSNSSSLSSPPSSVTPSQTQTPPPKQEDGGGGKNELLSEFFKEHILDVHS